MSPLPLDPALSAALETSAHTRDHCLSMLDLIFQTSENPASPTISLNKSRQILSAYLSQLRGLNRAAAFSVRDTKQLTSEARSEIDRLHLQLQNLYYEQRYLRGEIAACENYDHKYMHLPLLPLPTFLALHPGLEDADEHTLMVARINHEHSEREALEQARQGLLKKKQGLIADNKKRREDLANLDKDLERFIDAAKPIQKTFEKEY